MDAHNPERHFPTRATALVLNSQGHVLVVRHRGQAEWALPGGQVHAGEDPVRRVVVEVAQETGLGITTPTYMGEYEGTRVAHQIFLAEAEGELHPDLREVEEAAWWNPDTPLGVQPHVDGILEIVLDSLEQVEEEDDGPAEATSEPDRVGAPAAGQGPSGEATWFGHAQSFARAAGRVLVPLGRVTLKGLWMLTWLFWRASLLASDMVITLSLMWEGGRPKPGKHVSWDSKLRPWLQQHQDGLCIYCRASLRRKPSDIDHVLPLVRGGSDDIENLQLLCPGCNRRKADRTDQEFRWRYREVLQQGSGVMPPRQVRQADFKALTQTTRDPESYLRFKSGKFYTPAKKVTGGAVVAGIAVFVLLFLALNNLIEADDSSGLGTACAVVGLIAGLGVRARAWYTGKDQEV